MCPVLGIYKIEIENIQFCHTRSEITIWLGALSLLSTSLSTNVTVQIMLSDVTRISVGLIASVKESTDFVCGAAFNAQSSVMPALSVLVSGMLWLPVALCLHFPALYTFCLISRSSMKRSFDVFLHDVSGFSASWVQAQLRWV